MERPLVALAITYGAVLGGIGIAFAAFEINWRLRTRRARRRPGFVDLTGPRL